MPSPSLRRRSLRRQRRKSVTAGTGDRMPEVEVPLFIPSANPEDSGGMGIFRYTNPILHFAPFLSTHFFPCLNPIFKNGSFLSVVALVSVTLLDSNPSPSLEKRSILAPIPSFFPPADFDN